jgi:ATP-dependent DNA helicase PIF1
LPDRLLGEIEKTDEFKKVLEALQDDSVNFIFVSGVAGTGKSTLISLARRLPQTNVIVVAPTGIAAMNIGGTTIHSTFRLPFGPAPEPAIQYGKRAEILKRVDLLIIDEISMVKADVLDAVSESLQKHRKNMAPFGGVKVAVFGDLFQLAPVVEEEEQAIIRQLGYDSNFFFEAKCFSSLNTKMFQLTRTFRQKEKRFAEVLNNIRTGRNIVESLDFINSQCLTDKGLDDVSLTLTTRTANADRKNNDKLNQLEGDEEIFRASTTGEYFDGRADKQLPAPLELKLKLGARVLFTKNNYPEWINGTLGTVVSITDNFIRVEIDGGQKVTVGRAIWEHYKHSIDEKTNKIERKAIASFTQFPLRLGWAVTIHKSQGLTLDSCTVDVGEDGAFTHGQAYVALSRCKTIGALKLSQALTPNDIILHQSVLNFYMEFMPDAL